MHVKLAATIIAAVYMGGLCGRGPTHTVGPVVSTDRLYYDDRPSAYQEQVRMIVSDIANWQRVWDQATAAQTERPPRPHVEFDSEMVIVVSAGRMRTGDKIRVDSAGVRGEVYAVYVSTIRECDSIDVESFPLEVVRVRREAQMPVDWVESSRRAAHCGD